MEQLCQYILGKFVIHGNAISKWYVIMERPLFLEFTYVMPWSALAVGWCSQKQIFQTINIILNVNDKYASPKQQKET